MKQNNYPKVLPQAQVEYSQPINIKLSATTLIQDRTTKEYAGLGFWLDPYYSWRSVRDSTNELILICEPLTTDEL